MFLPFIRGSAETALLKSTAAESRNVELSGRIPIVVEIDFGTMNAGDRAECSISISNETRQRVEIGRLTYSCPCVKLDNVKGIIEAGEAVRGRIVLGLASERLFHGDLAAEVSGYDPVGNHLFQIVVATTVRAVESVSFEQSIPEPVPMVPPGDASGVQP